MTRSHQPVDPTVRRPDAGRRNVRRAWLSLALLPVSFVTAAFLGDWLLSLQGYGSGDGSIPLSAALWAGGPALLVLIAPATLAVLLGLRARKDGDPAGGRVAVAGSVVAAGLVVLNLLALLIGH